MLDHYCIAFRGKVRGEDCNGLDVKRGHRRSRCRNIASHTTYLAAIGNKGGPSWPGPQIDKLGVILS